MTRPPTIHSFAAALSVELHPAYAALRNAAEILHDAKQTLPPAGKARDDFKALIDELVIVETTIFSIRNQLIDAGSKIDWPDA